MGASRSRAAERAERSGQGGGRRTARRLRVVKPLGPEHEQPGNGRQEDEAVRECDEAGTTTAEYTVVTGAAVAFGALLFKLLTSEWGNKILSTAFSHVISLLGF